MTFEFQSGGLSADHIEKHLIEFTQKSKEAGYHGGLSTNSHCALLQEPPENVHYVLDRMYQDPAGKRTNPFGCAHTNCTIWYMKGISPHWDMYGGNGHQRLRNGTPNPTYAEALEDSFKLAVEYPGQASQGGNMCAEDVVRVRTKLKLPKVEARMTDETCVYCNA